MEKSNRSISEMIEKLEELSLFRDRLDCPPSIKKIWEAFIDDIRRILEINIGALFLFDEDSNELFLKEITDEDFVDLCRDELDSQLECSNLLETVGQRKPSITHPFVFEKDTVVVMMPLSTVKKNLGIVLVITKIEKQDIIRKNILLLNVLLSQCSFALECTFLNDRLKKEHEYLTYAQARAIREEQNASMSRLTDGAYHNIINALNIISGNIQVLMKSNHLTPQISKYLNAMRVQSGRIDRIVKGLFQYPKHSDSERSELNINHIIEDVLSLLRGELLLDNIDVIKNLKTDLPLIVAVEDQLSEVLFSFISLASSTMDNGGSLEISTELANSTDDYINTSDFIQIVIKQNCRGEKDGKLGKIFGLFVREKEAGKGIGSGMPLSNKIVEDHGGEIYIASSAEKGTVFHIYLPILNGN